MPVSHLPPSGLTEVVDAVGVGTEVFLDDKLEIVRCLVYDHAGVGVAAVDDLAQVIPRMLLHVELGGVHVLHLHHFCAVRELVHTCHRCQSRSDPVVVENRDLKIILIVNQSFWVFCF